MTRHDFIGAMHVSDTHFTFCDARDDARKQKLAASRVKGMRRGEHYLDEAILCGHVHFTFADRFSKTAMTYVVGANFGGAALMVSFE